MSIKTSRERKRDAIIGWIITLIIIAGIIWGGHKLFGWGNDFLNRVNHQHTEEQIDTAIVHDTIVTEHSCYKDSIQLTYENGHHYIVVNLNGIKMKGMLDSGCSAGISGCAVDYAFLHRYGYVKHPVSGSAIIANGDTVQAISCTAYNVSIENVLFDSVQCSFVDSQNSQLLIGQDILKKLGAYVIDYNNNMLYIK